MITDTDIKKLKSVFATKDDISGLASKDDLGRLASKKDVEQLKTRLDTLEDNLTGEIAKLHNENLVTSTYRGRIEDHEERITAIEQKLVVAN